MNFTATKTDQDRSENSGADALGHFVLPLFIGTSEIVFSSGAKHSETETTWFISGTRSSFHILLG